MYYIRMLKLIKVEYHSTTPVWIVEGKFEEHLPILCIYIYMEPAFA